MMKIFFVKWILVVLVAGSSGGSMTKLATFNSEAQCRKAQDEVDRFRKEGAEKVAADKSLNVQVALIADCLTIPVDETADVEQNPIVPGGSGK